YAIPPRLACSRARLPSLLCALFFAPTPATPLHTLSLHDALPISASMPRPRKDAADVRFALSKLALKTYGMPRRAVMSRIVSATWKTRSRLSMTHGPAITNRGLRAPISYPQRLMGSGSLPALERRQGGADGDRSGDGEH